MEETNKISLFAAILMNINIMVGAGIFLMPSMMAQKAGNASFLGWPLAGLLFLPIVWSIAQVTKLFPEQGSFYTYSKNGIGKLAGFISGWLYFLGYVSITSLQTIGLREVLVKQMNLTWVGDSPILFNAIFVGLICLLNLFNLAVVAKIQNGAVLFKLTPLFLVFTMLYFIWNPGLDMFAPSGMAGLQLTVPVALFGFWGFECCASVSHLIRGDKANASRAILIGFYTTVALYALFHLGILHLMGADNLINQGVGSFVNYLPFDGVITKLLTALVSASITVAFISAIYGGFIANSALLHAMADEKLLFMSDTMSKTNKHGRPWATLLVQGLSVFLFTSVIGSTFVLNAMSNLGVLCAFFLTLISLFLIQSRKGQMLGALVTAVAFACCVLLTSYSWTMIGATHMARFQNMIPMLGIMAVGMIMYFVKNARNGQVTG